MKSNKSHIYGLIFSLFLIGIALFLYRHLALDVPLKDNELVNSWMIEANLRFVAQKNIPVKAQFTIPYTPPYFAILDEYFMSHHYGVTTYLNNHNRYATWMLRRGSGLQSLYYRAILREMDSDDFLLKKPPPFKLLQVGEHQKEAIDNIISQARQSSVDIATFSQAIIKELNRKEGSARFLIGTLFSDEELVKAAILILNQAKIQAMPVQGIVLKEKIKASFNFYLAVYNGKIWLYLNPHTGALGLPKDFLVWQYGFDHPFSLMGGKNPQFFINLAPTPINALTVAKERGLKTDSQLLRFSLLQLPVHVQETYKVLLTIPVGTFIILLLRNFIGIKTFGTFMPVLIALAFRETHLVWGIFLFSLIVFLGLLVRFYLDQLRLLIVPRLAAILTIVILLMIFIGVISQSLGLDAGLSVALFPMVILTMTIERMCIIWDERGAAEALKVGGGSLLAASMAFEAMSFKPLQYLIFAFPELLLLVLSLTLWFGQYCGYRLFELHRFKALCGEPLDVGKI